MTLDEVFAEVERRAENKAFCQVLLCSLKERVGQGYREEGGEPPWDVELCRCRGFAEFLQTAEEVFAEEAENFAISGNDPVYKQATQIAETLRLIIERETGQRFPKIDIESLALSPVFGGLVTADLVEEIRHRRSGEG